VEDSKYHHAEDGGEIELPNGAIIGKLREANKTFLFS
jgi:hypothetical protein